MFQSNTQRRNSMSEPAGREKRPRQNTSIDLLEGNVASSSKEDLGRNLSQLRIGEENESTSSRVPEAKFLGIKVKDGIQYIKISEPSEEGNKMLTFGAERIVGKGSFGVVYLAKSIESGTKLAIKKVFQDKRFKNRELQIMRIISHPNIVGLRHYYYSSNSSKELYLNMILEFVPDTLFKAAKQYVEKKQKMPISVVKLYTFQLMRGLAYLHSKNICHRDIKPQNVLVNSKTGDCKLCDFGSAKCLVKGESNISYICSRYYRAPELVFGATEYTTAIDVWSAGCVMAELILGQPVFVGESGVDQLVEIIKVLGTPSKEEIATMNPNYKEMKFPQIKGSSLEILFQQRTSPEAIDLLKLLLKYSPRERISAAGALSHDFFKDLIDESIDFPPGMSLPNIYNWQPGELDAYPEKARKALEEQGLT